MCQADYTCTYIKRAHRVAGEHEMALRINSSAINEPINQPQILPQQIPKTRVSNMRTNYNALVHNSAQLFYLLPSVLFVRFLLREGFCDVPYLLAALRA